MNKLMVLQVFLVLMSSFACRSRQVKHKGMYTTQESRDSRIDSKMDRMDKTLDSFDEKE